MNFYKNFREKYPSKPEQIFIHYSNFEFENWINFQTHVQHARFQAHSLFRKQEMAIVIKKFLFYFYNRKKKKKKKYSYHDSIRLTNRASENFSYF